MSFLGWGGRASPLALCLVKIGSDLILPILRAAAPSPSYVELLPDSTGHRAIAGPKEQDAPIQPLRIPGRQVQRN